MKPQTVASPTPSRPATRHAKRRRFAYVTKTIRTNPAKRKLVSMEEFTAMRNLLLTLETLSQNLVTQASVDQILENIMKTLGQALGAIWVNLWDLTPDGKKTFIRQGYGGLPHAEEYVQHSREQPIRIGTAWIGRAIKTKRPWGTSDSSKDPRLPRSWVTAVKKQNFRAILCVPQVVESAQAIGGMCVYFDQPKVLSDFEMRLVSIAANQAAVAILNARTYGDLLAERDKSLGMIRSLNEGVILYDIDGRVTHLNPAAEELLLVSGKDILGKIVTADLAEKSPSWRNVFNISRLALGDYQTREYIAEGPNRVVLEVTMIPVRSAEYRKIGTMQILRDVTREKEIDLLKSGFIATASHQLRTPITGVRWALASLLNGDAGPLNPDQQKLIAESAKSATQLVELLGELLLVSRMEEGHFGYGYKIQQLAPIVRKVIANAAIALRERTIALTFEEPPDPLPDVSVNAEAMAMAIQNVLDNAIRYSPKGKPIRVTLTLSRNYLVLSIHDRGIGIPKEDQKFIFVKFYRAKNAVRFQTEGSGLGLFIAKNIVEKHNGRIEFESSEGEGSRFDVYLPTKPDAMPKERIEEHPATAENAAQTPLQIGPGQKR